MKRRQFVGLAGSSLAALGGIGSASAQPSLVMVAHQPDGTPLPAQRLQQLFFLDLQGEPWRTRLQQVDDGRVIAQPPLHWPVAIALQLPVDGFGDVWLYADRRGQGFWPQDFPLQLNWEFAQDRLHRVQEAYESWRSQFQFSPTIMARLQRSRWALQQSSEAAVAQRPRLWNQALMEALWAGEEVAIARAQQRIDRQGPRHSVKFGGNFFSADSLGAPYRRRFREVFDLATLPFYWQTLEPQAGQLRLAGINSQLRWLQGANIAAKGHPLVWLHPVGIPSWLRSYRYPQLLAAVDAHVSQLTQHYSGRLTSIDVINEAHGVPWANEFGLSAAQLLELTAVACAAAGSENAPPIPRIINCCCLWGRSAAYNGPPDRSPYRYLRACLGADVPFEVIGLQLYYPDHDLFEIDRQLDRFVSLGKPIHITEMATSSQSGNDFRSQLQVTRGLWHGPWSPQLQADWLEQVYTLAYSKPTIEAISWWDLSDAATFWPFGGLLDPDLQPKPAFYRLLELQRRWGLR